MAVAEQLQGSPDQVAGVQQGLLEWYRRERRDLPWRRTRDPYAILVSEVMLQQTQVDRVVPKYHEFLARFPTLAALAAAPRAEVIRAWAPLGYNLRAVRLHEIARQSVEQYGGVLPDTVEGLLALKGIGRYTAAAVACFAYGRAVAVLDTNVRRVLGRIFAGALPEALDDDRAAWRLAEAVLPPEPADAYDWNQALMDLGATLCIARRPRCLLCPVQQLCTARREWTGALQGEKPEHGRSSLLVDRHPAGRRRVAESCASYDGAVAPRTARAERFEGSRRWYRGRIINALRALPPGTMAGLEEIGRQVKPDYTASDLPWLLGLVRALARDGLIQLVEQEGAVGMPLVSLPP